MLTFLLFAFLSQSQPTVSFLDQSIQSAKEKIAKEPARTEGYNELALALTRKERETGDAAFLIQAESAVQKSLKLEPANFDARKARVAIRLRQHRFEDALEEAQALKKQMPDDNPIYGFISEAQLALGNYAAAESAVQFMINLRQVNGPGHERGAIVRECIGFPDAAIEWWNSALHLSSERDTEERSYIHSQLTRVYREIGKYDAALESAHQALALHPDYPPALFELARVYIDQGKGAEAAALLKKRSSLENDYWLARAYELAHDPRTGASWATFETSARAAATKPANVNALLIRYLADHSKPTEALAVPHRQDIVSLDAYAWAQHKAGENNKALEQIQKALEPGLRDAALYYDAAQIARAANQSAKATEYLKKSFEINTNSPLAAETLKQLSDPR